VLERLVRDPAERARLGQAGVGYAREVHEMHRVAEQVVPYYAARNQKLEIRNQPLSE
jgi:hypothetical protein